MTLKKISYSAISVLQVFLQMVFDFCRRKHFENTIFCEGLYLFNFYQPYIFRVCLSGVFRAQGFWIKVILSETPMRNTLAFL